MALAADIIDNIVPVSTFSRGGASRAFAKVRDDAPVVVVKNNAPIAVVSTPKEYAYLTELEEDYALMIEAFCRMAESKGTKPLSRRDALEQLGIKQEELDAIADSEIEFA